MHRLASLLHSAAKGRFPPQDGAVEIVGPPPGRAQAIVSFTAHSIIATSLDDEDLTPLLPPGDLGAPLSARTLVEVGRRLGMVPGSLDAVLVASGSPSQPGPLLRADEALEAHERVKRARRYRDNVTVWTDENRRTAVTLGQGLAGRWEVSVEIDAEARGQALASMALSAARQLLSADIPLWAQVAPGNAASLRAFLSAGFKPVCAEVLFLPDADAPALPLDAAAAP